MSPPRPVRPGAVQVWLLATRPHTLVLSITPVLVGTALAWAQGVLLHGGPFLAACGCALLLQTGTNLHNDVADAARGTDDAQRIGPTRVTAAGWLPAWQVRLAAGGCGLAALALGVYLVACGGALILAIGLASLLAAWAYSGGRHPVSHSAWGEVLVFVFFGLLAVLGSHRLQLGTGPVAWDWGAGGAWPALLAGAVLGGPAAAVLLVNNYRDLEGDLRSGRRTLVSRLGRARARVLYALLMVLPAAPALALVVAGHPLAWLPWLAAPAVWMLVRRLWRRPAGPWLNRQLAQTAQTAAGMGLLLSLGLLATRLTA